MAFNPRNIWVLAFLFAVVLTSCPSPETGKTGDKSKIAPAPPSSEEVRLVIWKSQYTLTVYKGDVPFKSYRAVFGKAYGEGDKQMAGDKRTPEGDFFVCSMNHSKKFYKFIGLSYPGIKHADLGLKKKLITSAEHAVIKKAIDQRQAPPWGTRLGGAIGIHGRMPDSSVPPHYYTAVNWTDGCIALANPDVDEIFSMVNIGTPVTILP